MTDGEEFDGSMGEDHRVDKDLLAKVRQDARVLLGDPEVRWLWLTDYRMNARVINRYLRNGRTGRCWALSCWQDDGISMAEGERRIERMRATITTRMDRPAHVYRAFPNTPENRSLVAVPVGEVFADQGFVSTSLDRNYAFNFASLNRGFPLRNRPWPVILLEIDAVPRMVYASLDVQDRYFFDEKELVLPPGTQFVNRGRRSDGQGNLFLTVVAFPPGQSAPPPDLTMDQLRLVASETWHRWMPNPPPVVPQPVEPVRNVGDADTDLTSPGLPSRTDRGENGDAVDLASLSDEALIQRLYDQLAHDRARRWDRVQETMSATAPSLDLREQSHGTP